MLESDKMKKIAILGCSDPQIPLINTAKKMGLRTIVLSPNTFNYSECIDEFYQVDFHNYDKMIEILLPKRIDGVCSIVSEQAVIPTAIICDRLKLSGITKKSAHICTNKILLKKAFSLSSMPTPDYIIADVNEPISVIDEKCKSIHYPVVIKPKNMCSSKGVLFIKDTNDLIDKMDYFRKFATSDFLIEKYIDGESFGLEVLVNDGKILFILPVGNISLTCEMIDIPIGHYTPFDSVSKLNISMIRNAIIKFIDICKIRNSFLTIDCKITNGGIFFLEVGLRCGGVLLPQLISHYYGFNIYECIIKQSLGNNDVHILMNNSCDVATTFLISQKYRNIYSEFINNEDVLEMCIYRDKQRTIETYFGNYYKLGHIVLKSTNNLPAKDQLDQLVKQLLQ